MAYKSALHSICSNTGKIGVICFPLFCNDIRRVIRDNTKLDFPLFPDESFIQIKNWLTPISCDPSSPRKPLAKEVLNFLIQERESQESSERANIRFQLNRFLTALSTDD